MEIVRNNKQTSLAFATKATTIKTEKCVTHIYMVYNNIYYTGFVQDFQNEIP